MTDVFESPARQPGEPPFLSYWYGSVLYDDAKRSRRFIESMRLAYAMSKLSGQFPNHARRLTVVDAAMAEREAELCDTPLVPVEVIPGYTVEIPLGVLDVVQTVAEIPDDKLNEPSVIVPIVSGTPITSQEDN